MPNLAKQVREQHPGATVAKRTRNSVHLDTGGGRHVAYINQGNDYHTTAGVEIDTAWQPVNVDGFQWGMTLAEYYAHARNLLNAGDLVRFTHPASGAWVIFDPQSINWVNQDNSRQQIAIKQAVAATAGTGEDDNLLTWAAGYGAGRHFTYRCVPQRLEKNIVIDTWAALPAPPAWLTGTVWFEAEFVLKHSAGLTLWLDGVQWAKRNNERVKTGNRIAFRDAGGVEVFGMDAPFARDANGATTAAEYELRVSGGSYFVTVRVARAWLEAAAYPVAVDPSLEVEGATADGYIIGDGSDYPTARTTSYDFVATTGYVVVGQAGISEDAYFEVMRGFLLFDTATLAGATVTQANLKLTAYDDYSDTDFDVQIVKQDWSGQNPLSSDNMGTAFNNCLSATADDSIWRNTSGMATNTPYTSGNLSTAWVNTAGTTYYSLRSSRDYGNVESSGNEIVYLYTAEATTAAYRPTLIVAYSVPQRLYPDGDDATGWWKTNTGPAALYTAIDEETASSIDYIQSSYNPAADVARVTLSSPAATPGAGAWQVVYSYVKYLSSPVQVDLTVRLKQGTTTIATWTHSDIGTGYTMATQTLTGPQVAAISDPGNLLLEFQADTVLP